MLISDWLNTIFKWFLMGNRPYWYSDHLEQFPGTCETGPGNPSGHCMIPSAVLTVLSLYNFPKFGSFLMVLSVAVSRLYLAAHFPHQVVLGSLIGYSIGKTVFRLESQKLCQNPRYWLKWGLTVLISGYTICYFFSIILSIDLLWTLQKAKESCKNPDWVHLNTTPLNTLWRLSGLAIGMMRYRELADSQSIPRTLPKRVFSAICSIVFNFSLFPALQTAIYQWSGESLYVFYACSSFHFMLIPVCLMFFTKFV